MVLRSSRMRWYGHVEHNRGWISQVRKLNMMMMMMMMLEEAGSQIEKKKNKKKKNKKTCNLGTRLYVLGI